MTARPLSAVLAAWLVPGAGHFLTGERRKAAIFFVVLNLMFAIGLMFRGEFFALDRSDLLVLLGGLAQWAMGAPRLIAGLAGAGSGDVIAATYEAGNTFLIVSGLLNMLVALDAYDLARGVKRS